MNKNKILTKYSSSCDEHFHSTSNYNNRTTYNDRTTPITNLIIRSTPSHGKCSIKQQARSYILCRSRNGPPRRPLISPGKKKNLPSCLKAEFVTPTNIHSIIQSFIPSDSSPIFSYATRTAAAAAAIIITYMNNEERKERNNETNFSLPPLPFLKLFMLFLRRKEANEQIGSIDFWRERERGSGGLGVGNVNVKCSI